MLPMKRGRRPAFLPPGPGSGALPPGPGSGALPPGVGASQNPAPGKCLVRSDFLSTKRPRPVLLPPGSGAGAGASTRTGTSARLLPASSQAPGKCLVRSDFYLYCLLTCPLGPQVRRW